MHIWNTSYADTYEKICNKYDIELPLSYKKRLDQYDKEKQEYNRKNKERIKEVKINKKLNTKKLTDPDNNQRAVYVPYNQVKRRRTIDLGNVKLDRIATPRIPKKPSSNLPSSSKK